MRKVFIGGSRRVTRLNSEVRKRLDRIIERQLPVLIGDANGADKAVQQYLQDRGYNSVEVFCVGQDCRNNVGHWKMRAVPSPRSGKGFAYYAVKDREMAREASIGFMLWDGKSMGTLANIFRLVKQRKKVAVYTVPTKTFTTLKDESDWERFLSRYPIEVRRKVASYTRSDVEPPASPKQGCLF
jgi:hypothetical protein